jgi:hypothetical protein
MRGAPQKTIDAVFALIERAALAGERCPTNASIDAFMQEKGLDRCGDSGADLIRALARSGRMVFTVHARNWRVAEILTGPNALKATAPAPNRWAAYLRIGRTTERLTT